MNTAPTYKHIAITRDEARAHAATYFGENPPEWVMALHFAVWADDEFVIDTEYDRHGNERGLAVHRADEEVL